MAQPKARGIPKKEMFDGGVSTGTNLIIGFHKIINCMLPIFHFRLPYCCLSSHPPQNPNRSIAQQHKIAIQFEQFINVQRHPAQHKVPPNTSFLPVLISYPPPLISEAYKSLSHIKRMWPDLPISSSRFFRLVVPTIGAVTPSFERDHKTEICAIERAFFVARSWTL